jgi:hypothetical protein
MNTNDPDKRLERMKQVLAESFPRTAEGQEKEPLPASVRAALQGPAARETAPVSFVERVLAWFRGPQLAMVAVTAVLVLFAVVQFGPGDKPATGGTDTMRSGGGTAELPPVIVLHGLSSEQVDGLKASGYFRPEQLLVVPAGEALDGFLESHRRPQLVLVDGTGGEITLPFAGEGGPAATAIPADNGELAPLLLDLLGNLPDSGQ